MAANKTVTFGPLALTVAVQNVAAPGTTSVVVGNQTLGVSVTTLNHYMLIRHLRVVNTTASAVSTSLFVGARGGTAAGSEFLGSTLSVAANSFTDWYSGSSGLRLEFGATAAALTATASAVGLTIEGEGEIGFV